MCMYSFNDAPFKDSLLNGKDDYLVLTKNELAQIDALLCDQITEMAKLYAELKVIAADLMKNHAPKSTLPIVDKIIGKTLFFRTVGFIGKCAVDSGIITIPDDEKPIAIFAYEICDDDKKNASIDIQSK